MANRWDSNLQAWVDDLGHQWNPDYGTWGPVKPGGSSPAGAGYQNGMGTGGGGAPGGTGYGGSGSYPGSGTGGYAGIGVQYPLDAASIAHMQAQDAQAAQNAQNQASYQTASLAESAAARQQSSADSAANRAQSLQIAQMQFAQTMAQNQAQYALDVQRFGLSQAEFNYQQKKDEAANKLLAAQFGMSVAQFDLNQNQFNAQQRQALADAKLKIDTLIASKKGPQDWVAYNNLLNGMSAPQPNGTNIIDPYAALKDMYQPSTEKAPTMPDLSIGGTPSNITPAAYPSSSGMGGGGTGITPSGGGGASGAMGGMPGGGGGMGGGGMQPFNNFHPAGQPGGQTAIPGGGTYGGATQGYSPSSPGSAYGVSPMSGYTLTPGGTVAKGNNGANGQGQPSATNHQTDQWGNYSDDNGLTWHNPGGQVTTTMAGGGTTGGAAIVGDSKSGKPTGHEEIAYAATNPQTGVSELHVIPHQHIASLLDSKLGRQNGTVIGAHKLPPSLLQGLPRAAEGGTFGEQSAYPTGIGANLGFQTGGTSTNPYIGGGTANPYAANAITNPYNHKGSNTLFAGAGGATSAGTPNAPFGGEGQQADPWHQPQGTQGEGTAQPSAWGGGQAQQQYTPTHPLTAPSSAPQGGGQQAAGVMRDQAANQAAAPQAQGTGLNSTNIAAASTNNYNTPNSVSSGMGATANSANLLTGSSPSAATGGASNPYALPGYTPDPSGSYGTAASSPYQVLNTYNPATLGSQPFIQKILGNSPSSQYGNFGANLSNPKLGVNNMPFNLSLQRYNLLRPSEQQQLQSLYEQGLSTDWNDINSAMQASAPVGHNRQTYAQAIQPARYGV